MQTSTNRPYSPPWRKTCALCDAGLRDEALIYLVAEIPFTSPLDAEVMAIAERKAEECVLALDENLFWCRIARPQAERIVRLLKTGQLSIHVSAFQPNAPEVLTGRRARLLPPETVSLTGLDAARRQPPEGFTTPHHLRASLKLGPNANVANILRLLGDLRNPKAPASSPKG